jgi:hypothetical protein
MLVEAWTVFVNASVRAVTSTTSLSAAGSTTSTCTG